MPRPSSMVIQSSSSLLLCLSLALLLALSPRGCSGLSDPVEVAALKAIKRNAGDGSDKLSDWVGDDPCGTSTSWTGIKCDNGINGSGTRHVTELHLLNMNLTGTLAPDLGNLTKLQVIDFMWNNITGSIPAEIGRLSELYLLLLNGNQLTGVLPPELGNLTNLNRIQIDQNNISGPVPTSFQNLNQAKHFHMNNNSLNGSIPRELGSLQNLVHLLLDNNALTGEIPPEISNISTLLIVQLDNNQFQGSIPSNFSDMKKLTKLSLRNCNLSGEIPSVQKWASLGYLDVSQNQLTGQLPTLPDVSSFITTLDFSYNQLIGNIPDSYYQLPILEALNIRDNNLDGNFTANLISRLEFLTADSVLIIDAQNNNLTGYSEGPAASKSNVTIRLYGNPACSNSVAPSKLCGDFKGSYINVTLPTTGISVPMTCNCEDLSSNFELVYGLLSSFGQCHCAYPLQVSYRLKSPGFAIFPPYEQGFQTYLSSGLNLSLYQVNVSSFTWESGPRVAMDIRLFPDNSTIKFDTPDVLHLKDTFVNWKIPDNDTFGPYEVLAFNIGPPYSDSLPQSSTGNGLSGGAIAGIVIGVAAFTAVAVAALMLIFSKRWRSYATKPLRAVTRHERIKVAGVKDFSFDELAAATKSFDTSVQIGQGGYGKVYRGVLSDGLEVGIKRAQEGSLQGNREFATEIELLSRVHHRNLLSLIGYCDDAGEQMLVYEFMPNGTLRQHLNFGSTVSLDFVMRIQIALGTAKGILYLHTEANPPIFHRDIKTTNILLDANWKAKVSDFGLSKLAPVPDFDSIGGTDDHVSTVVKGTPGYLDPEYFLTRKLTAKSDVYSFGVVLMELVTGMAPISQGRNLVREVNTAYEAGMILSIVDPRMGSYPAECLKPLVDLAVSCCKENTELRPTMAEVVRQLEAIWEATPGEYRTKKTLAAVREVKEGETPPQHPYVSSDIDGSGLMSGTVLHMAPR